MKHAYLTTKGTPIKISHFPGWSKHKYHDLMDEFARVKVNSIPEDLQIITCVDDRSVEKDKSPLIRQLTNSNIPFVNAAAGKDIYPWVHNKKIQMICDALDNTTAKYCLILDGIDVAVNDSDLSDIVTLFKTYNKKVIFNGTSLLHPRVMIDIVPNRVEKYGRNSFLNAGCCIGETEYLKTFYREVLELFNNTDKSSCKYWKSEQYFVRSVFAKHMDDVWFDYDSKIFQVWHCIKLSLPEINEETGEIVYKMLK